MLSRIAYNLKYAVQPRKPLLVARLFIQLLRSLLGMNPLRYVDFALDFTCNQNCQHCFARTYDHQASKGRDCISSEQYRRIIRQAYELGAVSFSIQGGEPLTMLEKAESLLRLIPVSRCLVSLKTNGALLNRATARRLKALGVDIVTISIDSGLAWEHDAFRGRKGAFIRAVRAQATARQEGLKVIVACTISRSNAQSEGVLSLIELCREWGVLLLFIKAAPSGGWQGDTSVLLRPEDSAWLERVIRKYPHCRTDFEANYARKGCGAIKEIIYISQYGDVMACPFIQVSMGNVLHEPLAAIRKRGLRYPMFSDYARKCLIAEDQQFLAGYLNSVSRGRDLPLRAEEFFGENPSLLNWQESSAHAPR